MSKVDVQRRKRPAVAGLAVVAVVVIAATAALAAFQLQGTPARSAQSTAAPRVTPAVTISWYVGLGGGTAPAQVAAEKAFVARYNATNTAGIALELRYPADQSLAYDTLKTEIAAGNAPDIVGPVGIGGRAGFEGLFWNLAPEIERRHIDLSVYDPEILLLLQEGRWGQIGLPYAIDPSFIFYNKDAFQNAGLAVPPAKVGESYAGHAWDWNALASLAARLTLDSSGRNATQPDFDPNDIAQWGIDFPGADARVMASTFGAGSFVADDGRTARIPPAWGDAFNWYHRAMWTGHIAPTADQASGALLHGKSIASGHVAMALSRASEIGSYGNPAAFRGWGMAVVPSWRGATASPLGVTTFTLVKGLRSETHLAPAFEAMLAIEADPALRVALGGMPADSAGQADWFAIEDRAQSAAFPGNTVEWPVLQEMAGHAAVPSPEANLPNGFQSINDYTAFFTRLRGTPNLDVSAELEQLLWKLQTDFDSGCLCVG